MSVSKYREGLGKMMAGEKIKRVVRKLKACNVRAVMADDVAGPDGNRQWYALRVQPSREMVAEVLLLRAGHIAVCPVEMVERKLNRYKQIKAEFPRPLLTSMVLVGFDGAPPWYHLFRIKLVLAVIGSGGLPRVIPHKAVRRMMRLSGGAAGVRLPDFVPRAGARATVSDGPFSGLSGVVEECTNRRARVLLELDGVAAQAAIDVPIELLAEAG